MNILAALEEKARIENFHGSLIVIHILQALCKKAAGEKAAAARCLAAAVSLAASGGYRRVFLDEGRAVAEMLGEIRMSIRASSTGCSNPLRRTRETLPSAVLHQNLSRMEREILKLVNLGLTNQQVGEKTRHHGQHHQVVPDADVQQAQWRNRTQAIARARQLGLL